ncbi:MAG: substrate-binding domain-containing protein [Pirellulales bacterium]|nr:substrate-binding domain-containing protein [Pirellulales bacterium]
MPRSDQIACRIRGELRQGQFGYAGDRFLTVRELAERFGISLSTAQKVVRQLKDEGLLVGDSTNPAKISLEAVSGGPAESGGPRRLGLVVTNIASPFFSSLCRHVQFVGLELGCQVLAASSEYDCLREERAIRGFLEIGVEGLLICPGLADECTRLYRDLLARGVPVTFVSRRVPQLEADYVVAHNFVGAASVAGHMLNMGYRSFGYIAFGPRLDPDVRLSGFRSALQEEGVELPDERVVAGEGRDIQHGYAAMSHLMQGKNRPRAVLAYNDLLGIGALQYCRDQEIDVPGEAAVAGFDNLPESRVTTPPLTTVDYGVESMARLAVQTLLGRIRDPRRLPNRILLEPHLVVRQSTDPDARDPAASEKTGSSQAGSSIPF